MRYTQLQGISSPAQSIIMPPANITVTAINMVRPCTPNASDNLPLAWFFVTVTTAACSAALTTGGNDTVGDGLVLPPRPPDGDSDEDSAAATISNPLGLILPDAP